MKVAVLHRLAPLEILLYQLAIMIFLTGLAQIKATRFPLEADQPEAEAQMLNEKYLCLSVSFNLCPSVEELLISPTRK